MAGANGFCALLGDATARCWGFNRFGQAGIAGPDSVATPVSPAGLAGVAELAAGHDHACARLVDGTVRCWGANNYGQLGTNNTSTSVPTPRAVVGISTAAQLAAGYASTCALLRDGSEWCWGSNLYGLLGDGTFTERRAPVRVMNLPAGVTAIQLGSTANCFIHGPERQLSCFGMHPSATAWRAPGDRSPPRSPCSGCATWRPSAPTRWRSTPRRSAPCAATAPSPSGGESAPGCSARGCYSLGFPLNLELD